MAASNMLAILTLSVTWFRQQRQHAMAYAMQQPGRDRAQTRETDGGDTVHTTT